MANKDGAYSWRPFTLIHPIIYVDFVKCITGKDNWEEIKARFTKFQEDDRVICASIPVESTAKRVTQKSKFYLGGKTLNKLK